LREAAPVDLSFVLNPSLISKDTHDFHFVNKTAGALEKWNKMKDAYDAVSSRENWMKWWEGGDAVIYHKAEVMRRGPTDAQRAKIEEIEKERVEAQKNKDAAKKQQDEQEKAARKAEKEAAKKKLKDEQDNAAREAKEVQKIIDEREKMEKKFKKDQERAERVAIEVENVRIEAERDVQRRADEAARLREQKRQRIEEEQRKKRTERNKWWIQIAFVTLTATGGTIWAVWDEINEAFDPDYC